jgi:hypothetical protein
LVFFACYFAFYAQEIEIGEADMEVITIKEWNILLSLNSSGFGFGFQHGKTPNARDKHLWEIEFLYRISHKAVLGRTVSDGRAFQFGKLYDLFFLRGGYGYQRILTHKPYYGGVQIRYFFSFGASVCLGLPTYLEILKYTSGFPYTETERYDPDKHTVANIYTQTSLRSAACSLKSGLTIRWNICPRGATCKRSPMFYYSAFVEDF